MASERRLMIAVRSIGRRVRRVIRTGPVTQTEEPVPGVDSALKLSAEETALVRQARPYTMTSPERMVAAMDAVAHIVRRQIPGALLECGVWRGGSILVMIKTLQRLGVDDRDIYLYDTFEGMTEPTEVDTSPFEPAALATWGKAKAAGQTAWGWLFGDDAFSLSRVQELVYSTGYPRERVHFVVGPVEATIPERAPSRIALLRLDTDWYESTRHELVHLYPRLANGGVLIIDDYGHWEGARRAVDEYFSSEAPHPLFSRIDYAGRMGIKY